VTLCSVGYLNLARDIQESDERRTLKIEIRDKDTC
jgi:hypothetical protein